MAPLRIVMIVEFKRPGRTRYRMVEDFVEDRQISASIEESIDRGVHRKGTARMPPLYSVVAIRILWIAGAARPPTIITRRAVIASAPDVAAIVAVVAPTLKVTSNTVATVIAVAAEIWSALELRAAVLVIHGIPPAIVAIARKSGLTFLVAIDVRAATVIRRPIKVRPTIEFGAPASVKPPIRIRSPVQIQTTVDVAGRRRAVEIRAAAPAVPVTVEIAVAVIAVPIVANAEDHRGNA
ncbi:hypothetical protein ACCT25_12300 [Rhizobium ruizarguesonis]